MEGCNYIHQHGSELGRMCGRLCFPATRCHWHSDPTEGLTIPSEKQCLELVDMDHLTEPYWCLLPRFHELGYARAFAACCAKIITHHGHAQAYRNLLHSSDISLLDHMYRCDLPVEVTPDLELFQNKPEVLVWFIHHAPVERLAEFTVGEILHYSKNGYLSPGDLRHLLYFQPVWKFNMDLWFLWSYHLWPLPTSEQADWVPIGLHRQVIRRKAGIRAGLAVTLSPDLVKYIEAAL